MWYNIYRKRPEIKTIWCPCDKDYSEFVKVFKNAGYNVINTHIDNGQDFLTYKPDFDFDLIATNIPFSLKNEFIVKVQEYHKPWAFLLSATSVQSASLIQALSTASNVQFIMFDRRISYTGDRPPFPSWYFTSDLLDKTEFYIYERNPEDLYNEWIDEQGGVDAPTNEEVEQREQRQKYKSITLW